MTPPLFVVERQPATVTWLRRRAADAGWHVVDEWSASVGASSVAVGPVAGRDEAGAAVRCAMAGAGVIVAADAETSVVDALCDDLRRFGPLVHLAGGLDPLTVDVEHHTVLDALAGGRSIEAIATDLHLSRRTIHRRLATARRSLGARTNAEAVVRARAQRTRLVIHPPR